MTEKIKSWWSDDRKWFCLLVNDGVNQATVSLDAEEARLLALTAPPLPADGGLSIEVRLRAVRSTAILECANALAKLYPDNASTNAFCAAIRSLVDRPLPADGVRQAELIREEAARIIDVHAQEMRNLDITITADGLSAIAKVVRGLLVLPFRAALASPHEQGEG